MRDYLTDRDQWREAARQVRAEAKQTANLAVQQAKLRLASLYDELATRCDKRHRQREARLYRIDPGGG